MQRLWCLTLPFERQPEWSPGRDCAFSPRTRQKFDKAPDDRKRAMAIRSARIDEESGCPGPCPEVVLVAQEEPKHRQERAGIQEGFICQPHVPVSRRRRDAQDVAMLNLEAIETRLEGKILFASLNAPPLNLLGQTIIHDLVDLVQHVEANDDIRVIVFRSSVPNYYIGHFDMTQLDEVRQQLTRAMLEPSLGVFLKRLSTLKQVSIAEIAGRVRGAGSEFILACDMRFAARDSAIFGHPDAGVGVVPGAGAVQHFSRLVGRSRALEALLGADDFSAELAERYGWINRVLPDAERDLLSSALLIGLLLSSLPLSRTSRIASPR
jgi:enoyl-CoA hydratase/carnithine racemase